MKSIRIALLALALLGSTLNVGRSAVLTQEFGTGADTTFLLLQFAGAVDSVLYTYHFTYDSASPLTGAALLIALDQADTKLSLTHGGTPASNFFVVDFTYNGYTEPTGTEEGSYFWNYFVAGGLQQDVDPNTFQPIPNQFTAAPDGVWSSASIGGSNRIVEPGSWDAWVFGAYDDNFNYIGAQPGVSPVPEPASIALLAIGVAIALTLRRRHA